MSRKAVMHVISHTHWDREWCQDFQGYRRRLVHQLDALLDLMERRPEYRFFHLDGQTCLLEDYVQIRPGNRRRLEALIRAGRILVGPWFVMPDEGLMSGESLVRNLLLGHQLSREWGGRPMPVGFVSDVFGHVSQLSQILAGFGITAAWIHRGTGQADGEKTELLWIGADGSQTLLVKAQQDAGYQDFKEYRDKDPKTLADYEARKLARSHVHILFGMDGSDHEPARWDTPEAIWRVNRYFSQTRAVHSSLPRYFAQLDKALGTSGRRRLQRFRGELRHPAISGLWSEVFHGTGSARVTLKQANDDIEYLLARLAEPLNAWAVRLGAETQKLWLDLAWRYLMLNHPHDSICGCSIDQVHRDMVYRFDQARLIGRNAVGESMQDIADRIDAAKFAGDDQIVTAFNLAAAYSGPVSRLNVELPVGLVDRQREQGLWPVLFDEAGRPVPIRVLACDKAVRPEPFMHKFRGTSPQMRISIVPVDRLELLAETALPPLGYRTYRVGFAARPPRPTLPVVTANRRARSIENDLVRLVARADGRVDLYDKATGTRFAGLNEFEDCGDAGQGYDHFYPATDTVVRSSDRRLCAVRRVAVSATGLTGTLEMALAMRVPADLLDDRGQPLPAGQIKGSRRSDRRVELVIKARFTLVAGSRRVDCRLEFVDPASRHRLRAIFPTHRQTDAWYGDTAFDLVRREIRLPSGRKWVEAPRPEQPIKNLVAVCDRRAGLALLTRGLNEAAVLDGLARRGQPIALTLYRNFVQRLSNELTHDSDRAPACVEYALLPFTPDGASPPLELFREVDLYKLPPLCYSRSPRLLEDEARMSTYENVNAIDPADHPKLAAVLRSAARAARPPLVRDQPKGSLAQRFVRIDGPAVISTVKVAEGEAGRPGSATIIRLFNPLGRRVTIRIEPSFAFSRAARTDLQERPVERGRPQGRLAVRQGRIAFALRPKEVATLRIE